jgi:hypothetical protein
MDWHLVRNPSGSEEFFFREDNKLLVREVDDADLFRRLRDALSGTPHQFQIILSELKQLHQHCKSTGFRIYTWERDQDKKWIIEPTRFNNDRGTFLAHRLADTVAFGPNHLERAYDGVIGAPGHVWMTEDLRVEVEKELAKSSENETQWFSSKRFERTFVYLDISDFSKYPAGQETLILGAIIHLLRAPHYWRMLCNTYEFAFCIGDGYIFAFHNAVTAVEFAAQLARLIDEHVANKVFSVPFHFRIGIHTGLVYRFWDIGRDGWNYIGDGINGGNRVLAAAGKAVDDVIYLSDAVRNELLKANDGTSGIGGLIGALTNKGRHKDKHDNPWRIYELNYVLVTNLVRFRTPNITSPTHQPSPE